MDFKQVWSFFSPGIKGGTWSETWYVAAPSLSNAAFISRTVLNARLGLLDPLNKLVKIRVSQVGNPRITTVVNVRQNGTPSLTREDVPAPIDSAIVCTVSSSAIPATRRWWLRGWSVGDAVRSNMDGSDTFAADFLTVLGNWFQVLAGNVYEILPLQKASSPGFGYNPILTADPAALPGKTTLTLLNNQTFTPGSQITISQVDQKILPGLKGTYTVLQQAGVNGVVVAYTCPAQTKFTLNTGRLRAVGYISGAIIDPTISGASFIGGRKSRSPFTGSRGAKSANRKFRISQ